MNKNRKVITLLIPFKNEEKNLPKLLYSIKENNYFPDTSFHVDIFLLNDNSTDSSVNIVNDFLTKNMCNNIKLINVQNKNSLLAPRQGVIEYGIKSSNGDYIAIVDADCYIDKNWLKNITKISSNTVLSFGYTSIKVNSINSFIQSVELFLLFLIAFSLYKLKLKSSCMGNNILISRKFINEIGGYKKLGFSYNDDQLLYKKAYELYGIDSINGCYNAKIYTSSLPFFENINQKLRWLKSGIDTDKLTYLYILIALLYSTLFFTLFNNYLKIIFIFLISLTTLFWSVKFRESFIFFRVIFANVVILIYPPLYFILLILSKIKKIEWKGNKI